MAMTRKEAEAIYDAGKEAVVRVLLDFDRRITELERRLNQNSQNSSQPPSSDGYQKLPPQSQRKKTGRRSGGQAGHTGSTLKIVAEPDRVVEHWPTRCKGCGEALSDLVEAEYEKRQVYDLPPMRMEVTEHRARKVCCRKCKQTTRGEFPSEIHPGAQYGERVRALAVYLQNHQLLPLDRTAEMFRDVWKCELSEGTLVNWVRRVAAKMMPGVKQIEQGVKSAAVVHVDETGMRGPHGLLWLHSASTRLLTWYQVHKQRGGAALTEIGVVPECKGVVVHDSLPTYLKQTCQHQLCNAHILRELTAAEEMLPAKYTWPKRLRTLLCTMKQETDLARAAGRTELDPERRRCLVRRYDRLLREAVFPESPPHTSTRKSGRRRRTYPENLVLRLKTHKHSVLRFLHQLSVPFDNNLVERDLRMMKLRQKISGCFRSEQGAHDFAVVRSFLSTVRKQGHHSFDAIIAIVSGRGFSLRMA